MRVKLVLTTEEHAERRKGIGASDAAVIMNGDAEEMIQLWRIKRGELEPPDLSRVLPVAIGTISEPLNLDWFEMITGRAVIDEGKHRQSDAYPWMRCTLDGLTTTEAGATAVLEAKHVNGFSNVDEVVQRYMPQVHHQMTVTCLEWAVLSIIVGTQKFEIIEINLDPWYASEEADRCRAFWECVVSGTPPVELPPVPAPVPPAKWRTISLEGNNTAAINAPIWLECRDRAKRFVAAERELKGLLEPDVGLATGYGVSVKRDKAGRLSIKEAPNGR